VLLQVLVFPAVIIVSLTGLILLLSRDWRVSIVTLAVQYGGIFILVSLSWSLEMSVVKLVAGWMAGAVLGVALAGNVPNSSGSLTTPGGEKLGLVNAIFRILVAMIVGLMMFSLAPKFMAWLGMMNLSNLTHIEQVYGFLILIGFGLLHLGLNTEPLHVVIGLLTVLGGFEIFYASVESSTLVAGLLGGITLGLSLLGAYLCSFEHNPSTEPSLNNPSQGDIL
jgi:drug/metabolite transporter superfamily protein YnfA